MTELEKLKHEMQECEKQHQIAARRWLQAQLMYIECFRRVVHDNERQVVNP